MAWAQLSLPDPQVVVTSPNRNARKGWSRWPRGHAQKDQEDGHPSCCIGAIHKVMPHCVRLWAGAAGAGTALLPQHDAPSRRGPALIRC